MNFESTLSFPTVFRYGLLFHSAIFPKKQEPEACYRFCSQMISLLLQDTRRYHMLLRNLCRFFWLSGFLPVVLIAPAQFLVPGERPVRLLVLACIPDDSGCYPVRESVVLILSVLFLDIFLYFLVRILVSENRVPTMYFLCAVLLFLQLLFLDIYPQSYPLFPLNPAFSFLVSLLSGPWQAFSLVYLPEVLFPEAFLRTAFPTILSQFL